MYSIESRLKTLSTKVDTTKMITAESSQNRTFCQRELVFGTDELEDVTSWWFVGSGIKPSPSVRVARSSTGIRAGKIDVRVGQIGVRGVRSGVRNIRTDERVVHIGVRIAQTGVRSRETSVRVVRTDACLLRMGVRVPGTGVRSN